MLLPLEATLNSRYFLRKTTVPAGDMGPPLHTHSNEDESFYLESGKLLFTINGKEIELNQGEFLNIQKAEKHTWKKISNREAELKVLFAPAGIDAMFIELDKGMSGIKEIGLRYGTEFEI